MLTNRAALGALAVVGVVAAGSGAYIANRAHPALDTQAQLASTHDVNLPAGAGAVTETENSVSAAPASVEPSAPAATAGATRPAPVRSAAVERQAASRARTPSQPAERSRPTYAPSSSPASSSASTSAPISQPTAPAAEPVPSAASERRAPEPPQKQFEELIVPADSVIGLQIEGATISSDRAKVEDQVHARVSRDVKVRDQVAIPAGSRAEGSITLVDKGGKLKDQARLGIRFHTIVLADGTKLPINTETIYRDGESPARESAAKIGGGAVGGAVLGAILGGKKGALIGSTVGAGAGGAAVMASDGNPATLPTGSTVTVRMSAPATVTVEK